MAFRIQKRTWQRADGGVSEKWRLIILEYAKDGSATPYYPKPHHYSRYGFDADDSYEQALEKLKVIRTTEKLKRDSIKKAKIQARLNKEDMAESAYLPKKLWAEFLNFYMGRRGWDSLPPKIDSHIRAFRKMVKTLNMDPSDWPAQTGKVYAYFEKRHYSFSYFKKLYPLINEYGYYYARSLNKPFLEVPYPSNDFIERMNDSNYEARDGKTNESLPLTPEHLAKFKHFSDAQTLWLRLSLYFGLRPKEVDTLLLKNKNKSWSITLDQRGTSILAIYQPKLVRIPRARRWKYIPAVLPEQKALIKEIEKGSLIKRPYSEYIQSNIGPGYNLYAGRKGFEALMRKAGQRQENILRWKGKRDFREIEADLNEQSATSYITNKRISRMMGHQSMSRTESNYREVGPGAVEYD